MPNTRQPYDPTSKIKTICDHLSKRVGDIELPLADVEQEVEVTPLSNEALAALEKIHEQLEQYATRIKAVTDKFARSE